MFIKQIVCRGFKSFKDVTLDFDEGLNILGGRERVCARIFGGAMLPPACACAIAANFEDARAVRCRHHRHRAPCSRRERLRQV